MRSSLKVCLHACNTHWWCCYSCWWMRLSVESRRSPQSPYHHLESSRPGWPASNCGFETGSRWVWADPRPPPLETPPARKPRCSCSPAPPERTRAGWNDPCEACGADGRCPPTSVPRMGRDGAAALGWTGALLCGHEEETALNPTADFHALVNLEWFPFSLCNKWGITWEKSWSLAVDEDLVFIKWYKMLVI